MNWGKIKGLFVETEKSDTPETSNNQEKVPESIKAPVSPIIPVDVSSGKTDQTIIDSLAVALEKANLEGFDYFEFTKILEGLSVAIPSEQMRFQTAFASASVMGASKQKLLDTADHYISVLGSEAENFSAMVADQTKNSVTIKEESVSAIDAAIKEKADHINALTQEINELSTNRTTILNEVSENRIKIQKIQNDFGACLKIFLDKISGDKAKISQYISG